MRQFRIMVFTLTLLVVLLTMLPTSTQAQGGTINPLSGLPVADARLIQRRPIAIKVENSPSARPQSGLDQAEVVYESLAEFGVTRFCAIFLSQEPTTVGPVRSARPSDLEIVPQYQAALAYSGASIPVKKMLRAAPDIPLIGQMEDYYAYRRIPRGNVAYEHTLYTNVARLRETMARHGYEAPVSLSGWHFAAPAITAPDGTAVAHVEVPFSGWATCSYRYDARLRAYRRFQQGEPHLDRETGRQYTAENVIVQFVDIWEGPYVGYKDGSGTNLLVQKLTGEGRCIVLRGGVVTNGRWVRWERNALTQWVDDSGQPILLNPGRTWIAVVPVDLAVKVTLGAPYTGATSPAGSGGSPSAAATNNPAPRPNGRGLTP